MAVFGNYIIENSDMYQSALPDVDAESLMMDESVEPCHEDNFLVASARVCAESTENMNRIMKACAIQEFCYFEENGVELVYEAGTATSFIEKAKSFFLNLWKKIQGIFKKAIMMFSSKTKDDKEFLNKYKKELNTASSGTFGDTEIDIYDYVFYSHNNIGSINSAYNKNNLLAATANDVVGEIGSACNRGQFGAHVTAVAGLTSSSSESDVNSATSALEDDLKVVEESDWKTDSKDRLRAQLVNLIPGASAGNSLDSSEFQREITEACQGDSSKDSVGLSTALRKAMDFLGNSKQITKNLDDWLKAWKKDIDDVVKHLNSLERDLKREIGRNHEVATKAAGARHTAVATAISLMKDYRNIGITFHSTLITQMKNCSGQSKAICVKALSYKKPKNESYSYTEESTGSLLDSIELI